MRRTRFLQTRRAAINIAIRVKLNKANEKCGEFLFFAKQHIALCLQGNKWDELRRVGYGPGIRRKFWSGESHLASSSTNIVGWGSRVRTRA